MHKLLTGGATVAVAISLSVLGATASAVPLELPPTGSAQSSAPTAETISAAFPHLLPANREGEVGYRNATCWETDRGYIPSPNDGDPEFGNWVWQWRCYSGGANQADPFYRIYAYQSAAGVESVIASLPPVTVSTDLNHGRTYTNYKYTDNGNKILTVFLGDPQRSRFLMFTDGYGTPEEVLDWWRSAPL
ncbi:hypothetical protein ACFO5K_08125 [Nocardia halotolerans]|uniref:Uncharacterized protein n=1 Tax=Nocardia halotolerans TaxID=1755878 RepID=A0ABV8VE78_9NOCA